ncbi:hypothetical protein CBR_g53838 [Chara braunii]|uniref:Reverse transcriptase domain-containing protein n=1 Tax=Chara braunii TaxID=69332 RepID=A0A388K731_CHABU|nr:hypothetical protein CBR_g53838 [Chara braunii]|eukprot:GBG65865.1 hypothetical protein CBR_g53838 [Chara braunii]
MADGGRRLVTLDDLIDALDKRERAPSNVPKIETFHFKGDWVSDWLDVTEQALVGLSYEVKLQRVLRYILHSHYRGVMDAASGSWAKFGDLMRRKYTLGDGLLTMADLEAMNKEDFSTIGAFVHEFKKKARKLHGISEEAQCATFLGLLTGLEATELTKYGEGSERLTWATIDKGVEEGSLDQVEQHQMRLQRRKRKERDATASGTPGVKRIVTDVLAAPGKERGPCDGPDPDDKSTFFRGGLKQGSQRRYKTIDKKCRPVPMLVTEDEEAYYKRERGLIRRMRERAQAGSCRINDGNEEELIIGEPGFLSPQERTLMVETMKRRHCAYAFNDDERGRLDVDKIPMIRIHTVPHEPWNLRGARYPNQDEEKKVVDYLDGKMRTYVADYSSGPYASPWFCFIKPNGTLRWVQDLQRLNAVTVRDARGLPNADALSESCAGRPIISLIDLYSGYDQFFVYPPDRPVTAMHTPRGLIHMNVAPQGWTNAVAMVQRHMIRVMQTVSPHITQPYIDDLAVKGPKEKEENEVMPGVRRFVWKHIQDIDQVLGLLEEHNLTASGPKSKHCMREATILGFVCNEKGWRSDVKKTDKILEWANLESIEDTPPVDGFLDQEEDVRLHINEWSLRVPSCVTHPIWLAPRGYERKEELVLKPFQEEDPWGSRDVGWMMKLALAGIHSPAEEVRTIEERPTQVEEHEQLMGGMYLLTNTLLQGNFNQRGSFGHEDSELLVPESQDNELQEGEIKEAFRAEEYDGIYRELGLLLSCEIRERDASAKAQKMRHLYVVRDGHLLIKRSDFSKAVMQRGGRDTRPRQGPQRAAGRGEQHEPPRRDPTPKFGDDNIELFLDVYRDHAAQRGWSVAKRIHHLRGIGRFEEPIAQICEGALTWPDVEAGMQRLRASPRERDGMPIRLEEGNAEEFILAYEHYMPNMRDREEPRDPEMAAEQPDPVRPQDEEVIMVGDDTPPCSPGPEPAQHSWPEGIPEPGSEEILEFPPETTVVPEQEAEMEKQGAGGGAEMEAIHDPPLVMPATERPAIREPVLDGLMPALPSTSERMGAEASTPEGQGPQVKGASRETREEKSARVRVRLDEIPARQAEMEAVGIEPTPPVDPKTSEQRIDELWARYEGQRDAARQRSREAGQADVDAGELREMGDLGFAATRMAIERVDRKICETAVTSFQWYSLLSGELRVRELEVEHLTTQLAEERARS